MRVPLSWLREHAPIDASPSDIAHALIRAGLEVEQVEQVGHDIVGVTVAEVLEIEELTEFKKPIRYVRVATGDGERSVICGATNFAKGDRVALAAPGARLPGDFTIGAREAYGRTSEGMICSARELGIGDDHSGIIVLDRTAGLGADVAELLALRDEVFDIAVTPDRGYCLSVRGVAREVATAFEVPFDDPGLRETPTAGGGHDVRVDDALGCPRYVARVVRGLDAAIPSPLWLQRRIALIGMRPISLAVDVTNYVMHWLGQPLHAFDLEKLSGGVVVRRAAAGERLRTLDDIDRALDTEDLLICDDSGPIAIAGVMGGATTEIHAGTTEVLLESAHFDPVAITRSSRRHRLISEASKRFERGVDPDLCAAAADVAVDMLVRLGRAATATGVTDIDQRVRRPVITMPATAPGERAGVTYTAGVVRRRLTEVGCEVTGDATLTVTPPSWRPDLREPVDLTEEVVRLDGYENLPSLLPRARAGHGLTWPQRARRHVGRALAAAGYVEVAPFPFVGEAVFDALRLPGDDPRRRAPRVANPVAADEPLVRTTLLPGLLAALVRNVHRGHPDVALFELAPVALGRPDTPAAPRVGVAARPDAATLAALEASLPDQPWHVAAVLAGRREPAGWWGSGRPADWADAVDAARTVGAALHVAFEIASGADAPFHPGRCAALSYRGGLLGHAGELHPRVIDALELPRGTCAIELDLSALLDAPEPVVRAPELAAFPPSSVDVALITWHATTVAEVTEALHAGAGPALEEIRLFDIYTGPPVPEEHRSLAYTLRFRSAEGTLTDEQVNAWRDAAVAEANRRTGATLRT